jgi:predicted porin
MRSSNSAIHVRNKKVPQSCSQPDADAFGDVGLRKQGESMRKALFGFSVLSAVGSLSVPAFAQSSVTLYGLIDEGIDYTNNVRGNDVTEMVSGLVNGSRWGMKGSEDLGGGNRAVFVLENGFNVNNGRLGQGGRMFGRKAYVGLSNDSFGTLTFGRQTDSVVDYYANTTSNGTWGGTIFSHPYDNDNSDLSFRINNAIKYTSNTIAGFQFGGLYAFSNSTGFKSNRAWSVGGQYANGPLLIAASYMNIDNPGQGATGADTADTATFVAAKQRVFGAGVNYTLGKVTLGVAYSQTYLDDPTSTSYISLPIVPAGGVTSSLRFRNYEANVRYDIMPSAFVGAAYTYSDASYNGSNGNSTPKWHTFGVMGDYLFSKRTDLYAQAAYQRAGNNSTGTGLDFAYVPGAQDAASGRNQWLARVALRHRF